MNFDDPYLWGPDGGKYTSQRSDKIFHDFRTSIKIKLFQPDLPNNEKISLSDIIVLVY